ncbi:MAG: IS30 family transposase, partial [Bacteroidales bacterium]|nr:IS30 family transposase [Bacteroidales bacterium]
KHMVHSITSDNGTEFAEHQLIAKKLKTNFYFAHPYASWERGINEYTNKLVRQYIPKSMNFNLVFERYIQFVNKQINYRPRKKLNYYSPYEIFSKFTA